MESVFLTAVLRSESKVCPHTGKPFTMDQRRNHAIMGIVTETGELVDLYKRHIYYGKELPMDKVKEEAGDLFWYIGLGALTEKMIALSPTTQTVSYDEPLAALYGLLQKLTTQRDISFTDIIVEVYFCAVNFIDQLGLDYEEVLIENSAKLLERYPEKFDSDRAFNREDQ